MPNPTRPDWQSAPEPPTVNGSEWLTLREAAERLRAHPGTIRARIASGALPAYRIGPRGLRLRVADVDALLRPVPVANADATDADRLAG
ncbi:helix-turn-helix domain-containing protein [Agromyces sp. PvR057]|uniref:helix-turn-helix domain-containing protein n=1 Tax=Agromyces sp. PvR057 TaxID=3156403 RepID=UPI0033967C44